MDFPHGAPMAHGAAPSPPAENATTRQDQAGQANTDDRTGDEGNNRRGGNGAATEGAGGFVATDAFFLAGRARKPSLHALVP
jgi:hypothetical protein